MNNIPFDEERTRFIYIREPHSIQLRFDVYYMTNIYILVYREIPLGISTLYFKSERADNNTEQISRIYFVFYYTLIL